MPVIPVVIGLCLLLQDPAGSDLVQSIEQQRGGRHWIDQPTEPPKSPEASQACFQIEPGFRIELVAAEPLVLDPVAIDFDHQGRMFAAEYSDYPVGPKDPSSPALSKIVLLEDEDSDGRMDKRTVFADHLRFCHSVMAFRDGVITCTDTEIVYLADTDSDGIADVREVWFDGFIPAHPQMQIGCPRRGFDNWIYLTYGHGKVRCTRPGFESKEPVEIPRVDFRFHPETMQFEAISGAGQFGNTIDNSGRRYFSSNRNPIMTDVLSLKQVQQNPFAGVSVGHTDVGPAGENTQVFPLVTMKSNWLAHAGTHTSACGVTAYRGGLFGEDSDRSVFVCEPVGHLITRSIIEPHGGTVTARRAREKADFLASTDTWFRPASLATGPDGALYIADMYRLWVEHPKFVPDDVAAKMDWRAGEDRGRIWRVVPDSGQGLAPSPENTADNKSRPGSVPVPVLNAPIFNVASTESLVALLSSQNGWRRMLGQRLLVDGHRADAEDALRNLLTVFRRTANEATAGFARLHALWTLDGMNRLTPADLTTAASDTHPAVRRAAAKLIRQYGPDDADLQVVAALLCSDADGEVRLQAILSLNSAHDAAKLAILKAVSGCVDDLWLQRALLISAPNLAANIAEIVVRHSAAAPGVHGRSEFLKSLSLNTAARGDIEQLQRIASLVGNNTESGLWWQSALVVGLADGLPRCRNANVPKSVAALLQSPPAELKDQLQPIADLVQHASATAVNRKRTDADRIAAMAVMSHLPPESLIIALNSLLTPGESAGCQRAAVEAARRSGRPEIADVVLARWEQLSPQVRSAALDLLLQRKESTVSLLEKMTAETIPASVVSIDQRLILLQHPDASIRTTAAALFGGNVSANRKEVAEQYSAALAMDGSAVRGAALFEKSCSKCHRINGVGQNVGPDISDTRARARDALLYDILDPNRRVDPQFTECIVVTTDGRLFNGLLIAEASESITLRQPEGREQIIPRNEIDEIKSSGRSLMPEGIERDVTVEQMADVLAFLKGS